MSHILFCYSLTDDARNWARQIIAAEAVYGINSKKEVGRLNTELKKLIKNKNQDELEQVVLNWLKQKQDWQKTTNTNLKKLKKTWPRIEKRIFKTLAEMTEQPPASQKFKCALTTHPLCPYDERYNWFMVSTRFSLSQQLTNITHELLHLQVSHYYKEKFLKQLGETKWYLLQELITVILNDEKFSNLLSSPDKGYPEHQKLRQKIFKYWQERDNFEQFLRTVSKICKQNF